MAGPTKEEKPILAKFRAAVSDLELDEFEQNDIFLLSWLRARELDLQKAEQMMRKSFEWREKVGYKKLNEWEPPSSYKTNFLHDVYSYDEEDSPIIIAPFGEWDIRKVAEKGERDLYLRFIQKMSFEVVLHTKERIKEKNKFISQFIAIFDMKGFSMRQLASMSAVEAMLESVRQYEANFPETLKAAYVVNAPRIFAILFSLVKPLLSARTLSKVHIYDSNSSKWTPVLLNNIPADRIPKMYGGSNTKPLYKELELGAAFQRSLSISNDLIETIVAAGAQFKIELFIDKIFSTINWKFRTTNFDIGFAIKLENKKEVLPYKRIENSKGLEQGSITCEKLGKYIIIFDNSYSRMRSKALNYQVKVEIPDQHSLTAIH